MGYKHLCRFQSTCMITQLFFPICNKRNEESIDSRAVVRPVECFKCPFHPGDGALMLTIFSYTSRHGFHCDPSIGILSCVSKDILWPTGFYERSDTPLGSPGPRCVALAFYRASQTISNPGLYTNGGSWEALPNSPSLQFHRHQWIGSDRPAPTSSSTIVRKCFPARPGICSLLRTTPGTQICPNMLGLPSPSWLARSLTRLSREASGVRARRLKHLASTTS